MFTLLKVKGIGASKHKFAQFAIFFLYFLGKNKAGQRVYTLIKCKLHLVDGLQVNILMENDILLPEGFVINIKKNCAFIGSCGVTIPINTR